MDSKSIKVSLTDFDEPGADPPEEIALNRQGSFERPEATGRGGVREGLIETRGRCPMPSSRR
jgi:hypothetical protein